MVDHGLSNPKSHKIAITGSSGLIGSKLVETLRGRGFTVFQPRREWLLRDLHALMPTHIINCVGAGMDFRKAQSKQDIWNANFEVPLEIFELSIKLGSKFINIGSILEKVENFFSPYVESKRALTQLINKKPESTINAISILTPIVFGLANEHLLLADIENAGLRKNPVILESPKAIREFIHITDFCEIIVELLNFPSFPVSSFEVGTGKGYQLSHLCESVLEGLVDPTWIYSNHTGRTNDYEVVADINQFQVKLHFKLNFELVDFLKERVLKAKLETQ